MPRRRSNPSTARLATQDALLIRMRLQLEELLAGDGFTEREGDETYCRMCGRTKAEGHREACGRYALAHMHDLLKAAGPAPGASADEAITMTEDVG